MLPVALSSPGTPRRALAALLAVLLAAGATPAALDASKAPLPASLEPALAEELIHDGDTEALIPVVIALDSYPDLARFTRIERTTPGRAGRAARLKRLLTDHFEHSSGAVAALLEAESERGTGSLPRPYWIFNGFIADLAPAAVRRVAAHPAVALVRHADPIAPPRVAPAERPPAQAQASEWNIAKINAPEAWARGYRGQGVVIGGMDTGVRLEHPDLNPRYLGGAHAWNDPFEEHATPYDADGHGTHTMGTILGGDASGKDIGVAPDANWIAARMWSDGGFSSLDVTQELFQWFLDPDGDPQSDDAPRAVSNSWGFDYDGCLIDFRRDVLAWRAAGILPVFASGNSGPGEGSSESPGNYPETFSVGATDSSDRIAGFSGRGPSDCDESWIKPDISAPGVSVRSAVGGGWQSWSGTSMATPHVAGAAAILLSADPTLTVEELEELMKIGSLDLGDAGPDHDFGYGRLDVDAALQELLDRGTLQGTVTDSASGVPLDALVAVELIGNAREALTDPQGGYTFRLPSGLSYTLEASAFGYHDQSVAVFLPAQSVVTQDFALAAKPLGPVTGTVLDEAALPIAGAAVALAGGQATDTTAADGSFDLGPAPVAEPLDLSVSYCGLLDDLQQITVPDPGGLDLEITLATPAPDDIESGANGWNSEAITVFYSDQWHLSQTRSHSGAAAWKCGASDGGKYLNYLDAGLVTRCYDIDQGTSLRFWHWVSTEPNPTFIGSVWDGGIVETSTDQGASWNQVFPAGGYPNRITPNPANVLPGGTPCWGGYRKVWEEAVFDLHELQGEVRFRFRFASDGLVTAEGWYVDDLSLAPTDPSCSLTISNAPTTVQIGEEASWDVRVVNAEDRPVSYDFWAEISGVGGEWTKSYATRSELGAQDSRDLNVGIATIPPVTPGSYTVRCRMGVRPDLVWAEDSFAVEVQ